MSIVTYPIRTGMSTGSSALFYDGIAEFPVVGIEGVLYVDTSTGETYVWNGSAYDISFDFAADLAAHVAEADPHTQYTTSAEVSADVSSAISAHEAEPDPHPDYITQTELEEYNVFQNYQVNQVDDAGGGVTYVGKAKIDGKWLIEKITEATEDIAKVYANESNNSGTTTFTTAWTNRLTLTYGQIQTLTGL